MLMSLEENKAVARRFVEEVWNQGNLAVLDEIVAARGRAHIEEGLAILRTAFPDLHNTIDELLAEDDRVMTRETVRGTHLGSYEGIPPTGRRVEYARIAIRRVVNGKIVERWGLNDELSLLRQIGAIPETRG
jgi:predicted ester cyclase